MKDEIKIDGNNLDLFKDEVIAVTYRLNDLFDLESRQFSFTNQFNVPITANNIKIFDFVNEIQKISSGFINLYGVNLYKDGVNVLDNAFGVLEKYNDKSFSISIYGKEKTFFELIEDLNLNELDLSEFDHVYDAANVAASHNNAPNSGYVYALVDNGSNYDTDIKYWAPAVYFSLLISKIVESQGYTINGSILSDNLYLDLLVPFSNDKWLHSSRFLNQTNIILTNSSPRVFGRTIDQTVNNLVIGTVNFDQGDFWESNQNFTTDINVSFNYSDLIFNLSPNTSYSLKASLKVNGLEIASQFISSPPSGTLFFTANNVSLNQNDKLSLDIVATATVLAPAQGVFARGQVTINSVQIFNPDIEPEVKINDTIDLESVLPDMTQIEFFKSFLQLFGLIYTINEETKEINLFTYKDIYNKLDKSKDWSNKVVTKFATVSSNIGNYGRRNYFRWAEDPEVGNDIASNYFEIKDNTLKNQVDFINFIFSPSPTSIFSGGNIAQIPRWETDENGILEPTVNPNKRLIFAYNTGLGFTFTGNGTAGTPNLIIGKFFDLYTSYRLTFDYMKIYYNELIKILNNARRVELLANLSINDVNNIDLLTPIYIEKYNAYFLIESINNFTGDSLTEVSLIRLNF